MINHLSFSSITKYLKCGKQWKYRYIEKLEEEKSEALMFGTAWHKMIKYGLEENLKNLHDNWLAISENWVEEEFSEKLPGKLIDLGLKMVSVPKVATTIQGLKINPETIELQTELQVPSVSIPVIGYIDMIGTDGIPIDIKTSGQKWSQDRADSDLQAIFYIAALEQLGMIELPAKFKYMIFTKTKYPTVQILETERTHGHVFALYSLINDVYQAIRRETFIPTDPSNWWCSAKYCSFYDICEHGGKNGN